MLVFRILATVFVGLSVITGFFKNCAMFVDKNGDELKSVKGLIFFSAWSILWRAFVIVALWII